MKGATIKVKKDKSTFYTKLYIESRYCSSRFVFRNFTICVAQKHNMVQIPGTVLYSPYQKKGGARKGGTVMYVPYVG